LRAEPRQHVLVDPHVGPSLADPTGDDAVLVPECLIQRWRIGSEAAAASI
jgi:hypothetical protein